MQSSITMSLRTSDETGSSDVDGEIVSDGFSNLYRPPIDFANEGSMLRKAQMYQDYMKQVPLPANRGSVIPFTSWVGLSFSIKQLYGQPLHYLTNVLLQRWDRSRIGSDSEDQALDLIIHPCKAEATIWLVEESHRLTSSHLHIAQLWRSDPMYHSCIDPIFPKLFL